ncbi:MAG TPA: PBP1A family penicillin-binding protein [Acidimicrobiales bacterium]|nr:PBP1A family penicillin-binding protein [Acidimicrobiales bacterium]
MRPLARFAATVGVAGAAVAVGVAMLAPVTEGVLRAGHGTSQDVGSLGEVAQNSAVYGRDGRLLAVLHAEENRSPVTLQQVPEHVVNAILDVEDERFWDHGGVNLRSTLRALVTNVSSGEVLQGGSTITQQLVKNALLTPEKSVDRKVKEALLAVRLEDRLPKREILERYLNIVYFGNGAYGLQAAAETYFNSRVEDLTLGQGALLAGIIRNPLGYDPVKQPDRARDRRDLALERMVTNGHLSSAEAVRLSHDPVPTKVFTPLPPPNDYFVEEVKQRLLADRRLGETVQERYNAVFKGGLHIQTSLDPNLQALAEKSRAKVLPSSILRGRFTSAVVSVEPGTGYVRAMVAGDDFGTAKYNLATQGKRQPGSSFKPFVLLTALEEGFSPNDTINGSCGTLKVPGFDPYKPGNYEGTGGGVMTLTTATVKSVNCAYARLGVLVGLDKVVDMAVKLGLPRDRLDAFPSISLGAEEATPLEMAAAYATIAAEGVYHAPTFIEKVVDRSGKVLFEGPSKGKRAFSVQTARVAEQVMRKVVEQGTGTAARLPGRQVAGKTGTSQDWQNAWFVGFTPQLATAVWMGSPVGNVSMRGVGGRNVTGGSFPAQIWAGYMREALEGVEAVDFEQPSTKVKSGKYLRDKSSPDSRPRRRTSATSPTTGGPPTAVEGVQPPPAPPAPAPPAAPTPSAAPAPAPAAAAPGVAAAGSP